MSLYPASPRIAPASGLVTVCLLVGLSACQHPVAYFQRSNREVFYSPAPKPATSLNRADNVPDSLVGNVPNEQERTWTSQSPVAYAQVEPANAPANSPVRSTYPVAERIGQHQGNARRLLAPTPGNNAPAPVNEHQPGPKPRKTLREILGLPPRKKLNWWQRISWQLKASVIVILVAVVFAILGITVLAIVFGIIGALLLIRGLKKSFKVRRGIFGLGG
ncbi:hypothetical protein [Fibrella arboris]|uniref:hypothetical protein n=1 Tax=Fibrella arboris TaxID=3242486 RepID=UPI003521E218